MTTPTMTMGWQPRRQMEVGPPSPLERLLTLTVFATLTVSTLLVVANSMSTAEQIAPAPAESAAVAPTTFVESASAPEVIATPAATEPAMVEINGFESFAEERGLYLVAGDTPVNIRELPGVDAATVGQVALGDGTMALSTGLAVTNGDETWMQVDYDGLTGWVRSDLMAPTDAR